MQVYANSNRLSLKIILFFIVVLFLAYLPVSSFLFFLKNDAFNGYFPPKFFMSESLHAGQLPLWNPYINFGIPQYGDMSGGYWSPVTWLVASTIGYNAYTFTAELLCYILTAGIGMYLLTGKWITDRHTRIISGVAYMCCGYYIGHLQHFNWLSGAAFLPFCFFTYLNMLQRFSIRNCLLASLAFFMLITSAHPGLTICAVYFFTGLGCFHFFKNDEKQTMKVRFKNTGKTHVIFIAALLLLSAGMIAGYLDILPYFVRGEKISLADSLSNPTNIQSWISALLPFATVKNEALYHTDISMRNCYFGLPLLIFFLMACLKTKNKWQWFLLIAGFVFMLLSAGGIFKTIAYKILPFIGYVRLNGEFRIFAIFCFILTGAVELEKFIKGKYSSDRKLQWLYYILQLLLVAAFTFGLWQAFSTKDSLLYKHEAVFNQPGISTKLKALIDNFGFYDTLWIQAIVQLFFLRATRHSLKAGKWKVLLQLTVTNLVITNLFNIPFTGVGKAGLAEVQTVLNKSPAGIPVPVLQPIADNDTLDAAAQGLVGDWSMYNKQIGVTHQVPYPIVLQNMNEYFEKNSWGTALNYLGHPFIFVENSVTDSDVVINHYFPGNISITARVFSPSKLILQQNLYPHWFYKNGNEKKPVLPEGISFMAAPVEKGKNNISFVFEPVLVKWMMVVSLVTLCCLLLLIIILRPKPPFLS